MKIHYITIEGIEAKGKLKLSDKGITKVHPGDIVIWDILPDEGVLKVKKIKKDKNSNNVFCIGPNQIKNSNAWIGVIQNKFHHSEYSIEEDYRIIYEGEGKELSFDPKIQVNS